MTKVNKLTDAEVRDMADEIGMEVIQPVTDDIADVRVALYLYLEHNGEK